MHKYTFNRSENHSLCIECDGIHCWFQLCEDLYNRIQDNSVGDIQYNVEVRRRLALWRHLLPYGYSYKASCARTG